MQLITGVEQKGLGRQWAGHLTSWPPGDTSRTTDDSSDCWDGDKPREGGEDAVGAGLSSGMEPRKQHRITSIRAVDLCKQGIRRMLMTIQKKNRSNSFVTERPKLRKENIYVTVGEGGRQLEERVRFKVDASECPGCIFGDRSFTCTCRFQATQAAPDFKLYEDVERLSEYFTFL